MSLSFRARVGAAAVAAALTLVPLAGCAAEGAPSSTATSAPRPTASATPPSPPAPAITDIPRTDIDSRADPQGLPAEPPVRVTVPALGIDMPVVSVGLDATGDVSIPPESHKAGWYRFSSGLRDRTGSIVVVSHIDAWDGIGPFSRLKDAAAGMEVALSGADGSRSFRVDGVAQPQKAPGSLAGYFTPTGPTRLVLITCGGVFDDSTGHYRDNVIVTATPVDG
ncbi:class F sortase [Leifsonia sp. AG29]|uniref:class F sortase n=1 Tax=Leifsonia sp. AG29 TaxID=2598860 RepID=UPI00131A6E07|nr:class F sortase [Leifsonia sp. AG29]